MAGDPATRDTVREALVDGRARLCDLVLVELWNGARGSTEAAMLRQIEAEVEMLPTTAEAWREAMALARACRAAGANVPATDLVIAACARHHGTELLHRDEHFDRILAAARRRT